MNISLSRLDFYVALTLSAMAFGESTVTEAYQTIVSSSPEAFTLDTFAARVQTAMRSRVINSQGAKIVGVAA